MLKLNSKDYEEILNKLKIKKSEGGEIILKFPAHFAKSRYQNVAVGAHQSEQLSEYHTHDFFEVNYVYEGNCINLVEDETLLMNCGDMIVIHPGVFHTLYADGECKVFNFIIKKEWLCDKAGFISPSDTAMYSFLERSKEEDYYKYILFRCSESKVSKNIDYAKKLVKCSNNDSPWAPMLEESALLEFLASLGDTHENVALSKGTGSSSYKMINILMYVADNYNTITLDELSKKFFYSKTHICRLFLKNTGKSFNQTLTDMKINRSCFFLKNTEMTIEDISKVVGYGSPEHFQRLFKKMIGVTPGEFRKNSKKK